MSGVAHHRAESDERGQINSFNGANRPGMTNELGKTIRQTRKKLKLTLRELGEQSGLTVSQLSKLENGKQRISVDVALKIAGVLRVPVTSLLSTPRQVPLGRRSITRA